MLDPDLCQSEKEDCALLHLGEIDPEEFKQRNQHRYALQEERWARQARSWWRFWKRAQS